MCERFSVPQDTTNVLAPAAPAPGEAGEARAVRVVVHDVYELRCTAPVLFGTEVDEGAGSLQTGITVDPAAPLRFLASASEYYVRAQTTGDVVVSVSRMHKPPCGCRA